MREKARAVDIGPFELGVNHRLPDYDLVVVDRRTGNKRYLRSAVNVDVGGTGFVSRRSGSTLALSGADWHSLFSYAGRVYAVDYDTMYTVARSSGAWARTAVRAGLTPGKQLSYTDADRYAVFTNGVVIERIQADSTVAPLGVPPLAKPPTVTASTGGSLPAGVYQLAFTQRNAAGEESAATLPIALTVPALGTIQITGLPALAGTVTGISVYMTRADDSTLLSAGRITSGASTYTLTAMPTLGARCQTLFMAPMPAGSIVRYSKGRLFVATGNVVVFSAPFAPALYDPTRDFIPLPQPVTMIEPVASGVFIATTEKTYWLEGDVLKATLQEILPYGAIPGASGTVENSTAVWWMSTRGLVKGEPDGKVTNLQEEATWPSTAQRAAGFFREQDGEQHVVVPTFGAQPQTTVVRSFMDAEVVRKETIL